MGCSKEEWDVLRQKIWDWPTLNMEIAELGDINKGMRLTVEGLKYPNVPWCIIISFCQILQSKWERRQDGPFVKYAHPRLRRRRYVTMMTSENIGHHKFKEIKTQVKGTTSASLPSMKKITAKKLEFLPGRTGYRRAPPTPPPPQTPQDSSPKIGYP